jgi:predicted nuclease of predicted toxin-antitoxin system
MKLLFDQNLSPRLAVRLADLHPGSAHVQGLGLDQATDQEVWDSARTNGYVIVSKDADYPNLAVLHGHPPKVIWLRLGNCTTREVEDTFRGNDAAVQAFDADPAVGVLELH